MSDAPITKLKAPVHLRYTIHAGRDLTRFLRAIADGRLVGKRCSECRKVYVPPRGACPTCGIPMQDDVEVADKGTITTFCVVNVPFEGQTMKLPYVYASVLLDGADLPILHLIEMPADQARMGMRVKARWRAERVGAIGDIACFEVGR